MIPTITAGILYPKQKNIINAIPSKNTVIVFVMFPVFSTIVTKRSSHMFLLGSTPKSINFCFNNLERDIPNTPKNRTDNQMFILVRKSAKPIKAINNNDKTYPKY